LSKVENGLVHLFLTAIFFALLVGENEAAGISRAEEKEAVKWVQHF
jgi:hypothetical protein